MSAWWLKGLSSAKEGTLSARQDQLIQGQIIPVTGTSQQKGIPFRVGRGGGGIEQGHKLTSLTTQIQSTFFRERLAGGHPLDDANQYIFCKITATWTGEGAEKAVKSGIQGWNF
jgi:hypothetical protein